MVICYWDVKTLWSAYLNGTSFEKTATLGHQSLYLYPSEVGYFQHEYRKRFPNSAAQPLRNYKFGDYSDKFLADFLDVKQRSVIDASAYEGAETIHDLNHPIPDTLKNAFDVVLDCGTLEHIYNFPIAIGNMMNMIKVGGSLFISAPSNNLDGHGFFQFSPELMFRVFTKENGFGLKRVVVTEGVFPSFEMSPHRAAYAVTDPEQARSRVGLRSRGPVMMIVEAVKLESAPLFNRFPMQSDYVTLWEQCGRQSHSGSDIRRLIKAMYDKLPSLWSSWIAGMRQRRQFSFSNKKYYKMLN